MTAHALFIGTDRYADKNLPPLHCAQRDASELYHLFKRELGYGDRATLLQAPRVEEVLDALDALGRDVHAGDTFLLYFAGHGVEAADGQDQYLLFSGARMELLDSAKGTPAGTLGVSDLVKTTAKWPSVQRVMVFDACRTRLVSTRSVGQAAPGAIPVFGSEAVLQRIATRDPLAHLQVEQSGAGTKAQPHTDRQRARPAPVFIKSCQSNQTAVELLAPQRSMFGLAFDEVLQEARRQGQAVLANDGLLHALAQRMEKLAKKHGVGGGQQPWMSTVQGTVALYVPPMQKAPESPRPDPAAQEAAKAKEAEVKGAEQAAAAKAASAAADARLLRTAQEIDTEAAWLALYTHANDTGLRQQAAQRLAGFQKESEPPPVQAGPVPPTPPASPSQPLPPRRLQRSLLKKLGWGYSFLGGGLLAILLGSYVLGSRSEDEQRTSDTPQAAPAAAPVPEVSQRAVNQPEMVRIPAGSFLMGSVDDLSGSDQGPRRLVRVKAFELGKTEVTRGQYAAFVSATGHPDGDGCYEPGGDLDRKVEKNWRNPGYAQRDDHPVVCVNWDDAQAYIQWLNQSSGKNYRLPSEAEWEYAARAGCESGFNFGGECFDEIEPTQASYAYRSGIKTIRGSPKMTMKVGSFNSNNWGLFDMHGNVWEWVLDCYEGKYDKGQPVDGSAFERVDGNCSIRVIRGGSWSKDWLLSRATYRGKNLPAFRVSDIGFRLARSVP